MQELKAARVKRGLKQDDVAKMLNISLASYSCKENGKRAFLLDDINGLKMGLGLSQAEMDAIFFTEELMLTLKFGGTSMGSAKRILDSVEIMIGRAKEDRISVIVSAVAGVSNS